MSSSAAGGSLAAHSQNMPTHWLLVSSPENFETSRQRGFDIAGMKSRHRKKAELVKAGDTVLFYTIGLKAIAGLATVTGPMFEDNTHIWDSRKDGEEYPFRFPITPTAIIANPDDFVRLEPLIDLMEYPQRWPRANWTLAFQGNVHKLPFRDYNLLQRAVCNAAARAHSAPK